MEDRTDPRTIEEALLDADYEVEFQRMQSALRTRLARLFTALSLVGGTAAFAAYAQERPLLGAVGGLVVGATSVIMAVCDFYGAAAKGDSQRRRYLDLTVQGGLKVAEFDRRLRTIAMDDPVEITGLKKPAFNCNLQRHGRYSCCLPLSLWERFMWSLV